jgi:hypothetical protein
MSATMLTVSITIFSVAVAVTIPEAVLGSFHPFHVEEPFEFAVAPVNSSGSLY